jgi:hypothetical protein
VRSPGMALGWGSQALSQRPVQQPTGTLGQRLDLRSRQSVGRIRVFNPRSEFKFGFHDRSASRPPPGILRNTGYPRNRARSPAKSLAVNGRPFVSWGTSITDGFRSRKKCPWNRWGPITAWAGASLGQKKTGSIPWAGPLISRRMSRVRCCRVSGLIPWSRLALMAKEAVSIIVVVGTKGGSYQIVESESHAGGLFADIFPGPVTWYACYTCGPSDGYLADFPFRGSRPSIRTCMQFGETELYRKLSG